MKGSTLRRSNLSREKIAMLESLAKYNEEMQNADAQTAAEKQEELDFLWQNFKIASREKSPIAFFTTGVFVGVIATLIVAIFISYAVGYSPLSEINISKPVQALQKPKESPNFTFIPADKQAPEEAAVKTTSTSAKAYIVKPGDSLENISIKYYGSFSLANIKRIENANGMTNPDEIKIGQKLTIPTK